MLDKTPPDIPSGVVIAVQLFTALLTLKLLTITVVLVREPTLPVTTSLTRVSRRNVVHLNTVFFGLVIDVPLEFPKRPLLELTRVRDTPTNMS